MPTETNSVMPSVLLLCVWLISTTPSEIPECLWRDIFPFWVLLSCNHPGGPQLLASCLRLRGWGCWLSWCCCWHVDWLAHGPVIEAKRTVNATLIRIRENTLNDYNIKTAFRTKQIFARKQWYPLQYEALTCALAASMAAVKAFMLSILSVELLRPDWIVMSPLGPSSSMYAS